MKTREEIEYDIAVTRQQLLETYTHPLPFYRAGLANRIMAFMWVLDQADSSQVPPEFYGTTDPAEAELRKKAALDSLKY